MAELRALPPQEAKLKDIELQGVFKDIYEVVNGLPSENIRTDVIYCVPLDNPTEGHEYDKYLYIDGDWENLGTGSITSSIFVIDETSVPESVNWGGTIPETYTGQTGKVPEINFYDDKLWYLQAILERYDQQGRFIGYSYGWINILDGADIVHKMALIPSDPTSQQIEAMPNGQFYGDTVKHKGIVKGGQQFYDTDYIDSTINHTYKSTSMPPYQCYGNEGSGILKVGDLWEYQAPNSTIKTFVLSKIRTSDGWYILDWKSLYPGVHTPYGEPPITQETISRRDYRNENIGIGYAFPRPTYLEGDIFLANYNGSVDMIFVCARATMSVSGPSPSERIVADRYNIRHND